MPENPERRKARRRIWQAQNRERLNQKERERRARDPEKYREQQNTRRARDRQRVNDQSRVQRAWYTHGMRPEDWAAMWDAQGGRCYLCGDEMIPEAAHVDHDHSCCGPKRSCAICRRGLACRRCNSVAGWAADDPDVLQRITDNLRIAQRQVVTRRAGRGEQIDLAI